MNERSALFVGPMSAHFDGTSWPVPCFDLETVEWQLRYGEPGVSDRLVAASVLAAYAALIEASEKKRRRVVAMVRKARAQILARKVTP